MLLRALAAVARRNHLERSARISGQLPGHEFVVKEDAVVLTAGAEGKTDSVPVRVTADNGGYRVELGGQVRHIVFDNPLRDVVIHGRVDGQPFCAQIERIGLAYRVSHNGNQIDAKVVSPLAAQMYALMPFKAPPDLSRFLLSPMPGLLVDVTVKPGQKVLAGEKLAVIEAMKMENILAGDPGCGGGRSEGRQGREPGGGSGHHPVRVGPPSPLRSCHPAGMPDGPRQAQTSPQVCSASGLSPRGASPGGPAKPVPRAWA